MKNFILVAAIAFAMSASASAQSNNKGQQKKLLTSTEMIQRHTDRQVKEYGLDDNQAKKLLELNTKYGDKLPGMGRPPRRNGPRRNGAAAQVDGTTGATAQHPQPNKDGNTENREKRRKEMQANREAYNKELKNIMTDAQYEKYTENEKKFQERRAQRAEQRKSDNK